MKITRAWAMPNRETFKIKPIRELLIKEIPDWRGWADPFAGWNSPASVTNDLNPEAPTKYHLDALEFLNELNSDKWGGVLFDPPYSPRQLTECYKSIGKSLTTEDTQSKYWAQIKDEIARIVVSGGKCISFGWNSNGVGKTRGFVIERILLVAHGGWHNDTIVTVETKTQ